MADLDYEQIKKLKIRQSKGGYLTFAERNILRMYDKKMAKQTPESDESEA